MIEFKLQYYFEKYKDVSIVSILQFRNRFIKENGEFILFNELVNMIFKYQIKKYGELIPTGTRTDIVVKKGTYTRKEDARLRHRFGTRVERKKRLYTYDKGGKI